MAATEVAALRAALTRWSDKLIEQNQVDWQDIKGQHAHPFVAEACLDLLFALRQEFLGIAAPAPGQGYQPPAAVYERIVKQRKRDEIDTQISNLQRQRESL